MRTRGEAVKFCGRYILSTPESVGIGVGGPSGWSLTEAPFIQSSPFGAGVSLCTRMSSHRVCAALVNDMSCGKYPNELWLRLWRGAKRFTFSSEEQNLVFMNNH